MNNSHIKIVNEKIKKYLTKNDERAFLIEGGWGIGKTYYINKIFKPDKHIRNSRECVYISTLGLKTTEQLNNLILKKLMLLTKHQIKKALLKGTETALNTLAFFLKGETLLKKDFKYTINLESEKFVLIIDDIERSFIPVEETFGYIFPLTSTGNMKVIAICNTNIKSGDKSNEEKITDKIKLSRNKYFSDWVNFDEFSENLSYLFKDYSFLQETQPYIKWEDLPLCSSTLSNLTKLLIENNLVTTNIRDLTQKIDECEKPIEFFTSIIKNEMLFAYFLFLFCTKHDINNRIFLKDKNTYEDEFVKEKALELYRRYTKTNNLNEDFKDNISDFIKVSESEISSLKNENKNVQTLIDYYSNSWFKDNFDEVVVLVKEITDNMDKYIGFYSSLLKPISIFATEKIISLELFENFMKKFNEEFLLNHSKILPGLFFFYHETSAEVQKVLDEFRKPDKKLVMCRKIFNRNTKQWIEIDRNYYIDDIFNNSKYDIYSDWNEFLLHPSTGAMSYIYIKLELIRDEIFKNNTQLDFPEKKLREFLFHKQKEINERSEIFKNPHVEEFKVLLDEIIIKCDSLDSKEKNT